MHVCTDLIVSSGGNIKDFSLSHSNIWQANKKTIQKKTPQHKRGVKRAAEEALFPITLTLVEKLLKISLMGKRDWFAVSANIDGDIKFLGIPAMKHGTGAAQYDALAKVLEDSGICDDVKGLCFDTTASNTGRHSQTNIGFSQRQNLF